MEINKISKSYEVRQIQDKDIQDVYSLCVENKLYYKHCPPLVTIDSIKQDLLALPPNKTLDDKYYIGYYDNNELIGVIDIITNYPNNETVFIGFFMLDVNRQNKGIGSLIIDEFSSYVKSIGYKQIRLAWVSTNNKAENFWMKKDLFHLKILKMNVIMTLH